VQETQELCRVLLLNTYEVKETDPEQVIRLHDELRKISKERLEQEREEAMKLVSNPHIIIETASHIGSLKNVVLQFLKFDRVDLVVLGREENALRDLLQRHRCSLLITGPA